MASLNAGQSDKDSGDRPVAESTLKKIGILGGSFNPVHLGHLLIAETALDRFALDQVIWVPTGRPPHKSQGLLDYAHRVMMVKQAIADHPSFSISDGDEQAEGRSYALSTLVKLAHQHPNTAWYWLIGIDAFQTLPYWHQSWEVADRCTWLVAPRNSLNIEQLCEQVAAKIAAFEVQLRWQILPMPQLEISSSLIRHYCREGRSLRYLVPDPVRQHILRHQLY